MGEEKCVQNFDWKTEGKRPLGRPRSSREVNVRMCLRETGYRNERRQGVQNVQTFSLPFQK
jgi:hypothetical protein